MMKLRNIKEAQGSFVPALLLLLTLLLGLSGCTGTIAAQEKAKPVKTLILEESEEAVRLEYFGISDSRDVKKYGFKVPGKIARLYVDKGQKIEKGQLLAELDKTDLQFSLKAAEYTMYKAESAYKDAQDLYSKVKVLEENGASSKRDLDLAKLDMEVKEASFRQAQVDYAYKQSVLNDAGLYADMEGYVIEILNKEGEIAAAGYPVIAARSRQQVINVGLTQDDLTRVRKGTKAIILSNTKSEKEIQGEVSRIDQLPDKESRTYNVEISVIANTDSAESFYLGSTCRVLLEAGMAKGIWIPLTSIQHDGQDYVYVIKENRASRKNIYIRDIQGTSVRVEGIEPGDELVIAGMKNLNEGSLVAKGENQL